MCLARFGSPATACVDQAEDLSPQSSPFRDAWIGKNVRNKRVSDRVLFPSPAPDSCAFPRCPAPCSCRPFHAQIAVEPIRWQPRTHVRHFRASGCRRCDPAAADPPCALAATLDAGFATAGGRDARCAMVRLAATAARTIADSACGDQAAMVIEGLAPRPCSAAADRPGGAGGASGAFAQDPLGAVAGSRRAGHARSDRGRTLGASDGSERRTGATPACVAGSRCQAPAPRSLAEPVGIGADANAGDHRHARTTAGAQAHVEGFGTKRPRRGPGSGFWWQAGRRAPALNRRRPT